VLVRRVEPTSAANAIIGPGDVLLEFADTAVANDGTVPFRSGERICFSYLVGIRRSPGELLADVPSLS